MAVWPLILQAGTERVATHTLFLSTELLDFFFNQIRFSSSSSHTAVLACSASNKEKYVKPGLLIPADSALFMVSCGPHSKAPK